MCQLLAESALVGLMGGVYGLGLAAGGIRLIVAYSEALPKDLPVAIDTPVLIFLLSLSISTGLLFGLAPALLARREAMGALVQRGSGGLHAKMRSTLVSAQVAMALMLLVGAGLMVKSLKKLTAIDPSFKTDHLLTLEYRLPRNKYPSGAQQTQFHDEVVAKVAALPGVQSAGEIHALPFGGNSTSKFIGFPDRPAAPANAPWGVIRQGAKLTAAGVVVGCAAALILSRFLRSQLYEVSSSDPAVYVFIGALFLAVGLLASAIPARRAARVDPAFALRHE